MTAAALDQLRAWIQQDIGGRGLARDPVQNLITFCQGDFAAACQHVAATPRPAVAVVTGFFIPHADPPAAETDGPLGAVFLARALAPLGIPVAVLTDAVCRPAVEVGLRHAGVTSPTQVLTLPSVPGHWPQFLQVGWPAFVRRFGLTHLVALERPGPSHTLASLQAQPGGEALGETYLDFLHEVPEEHQDRCHNMGGRDITAHVPPAHLLFEAARGLGGVTTIGIGDGGNELGMGKVPWEVIRRNIPRGGLIACRVPTDHLLACGVSNWGAYAVAAGVRLLRGVAHHSELFDPEVERRLLEVMVREGPLVDGKLGVRQVSVDGLSWDDYVAPLVRMGQMLGAGEGRR